MGRIRIAGSMATVVAFLAIPCAWAAAEPPATMPASRPASQPTTGAVPVSQTPSAGQDWPQWRGPNRDGVAVSSPKLLDSWPKDGPPLLWKSDFIPAFRDGGCGSPVVADGKVFVYANKQPVDGGKSLKFVTAEVLADWGWLPDLPEDLAKKLEDAWASKDRPSGAGWNWSDPEITKKAGALDEFLAKKPELDKYIKDFIATLTPENAKKYSEHIRRRLCIAAPEKKWGVPDGLTWDELVKLSKLQDEGHTTCGEWAVALGKVSSKFSISHHISFSPCFEAVWRRAFAWSDTVICLDAATGKEIWKKSFPVDRAVVKNNGIGWDVYDTLGASGTPAIWDGKCYVSGSAGLYCLSVKDGSLVWQVKGPPEHASPLVAHGAVYHCGAAYDAETGKPLWKSPLGFGKMASRYSSPLLWTSGGKNYVITTDAAGNPRSGAEQSSYCCLDLETGKVHWTLKSSILCSTVIHDDILVAPVGVNTPLSQAYKISPAGTEVLWKGRFNGAWIGGLIYQDHLYGEHGALFCANLKTGEVNWKKGSDTFDPEIVADGKIFGISSNCYVESNPFAMFKAIPEKYIELGRFDPQACTMCLPALAGGKLYLRLKDRMACYDLQDHGVYLDGVTAMKDTLTFRFKQTGGGLVTKADGLLKDIQITDAAGIAKPAQARIDGDNIVVDIKDARAPFSVALAGTNSLAGKNVQPVPAFSWNESRLLEFRKAVDQTIVLKSDIPLQQVGAWDKAETFAVAGAKVTKVELDPQGKGVSLITDKTWKPGDAVTMTYPCFAVDQGDARRETLAVKVAEVRRASAKFVKTDTTTSGDWKGKYGTEGAMVAGDKGTTEAPKCAAVAVRGHQDAIPWAASAKDPTKLLLTGNNPGRSITCWQAGDQIFLDIEITDGREHQVAMYLANGGCPISVEVQDADTKAVLDAQIVKQADKGEIGNKYLVWNLKGNVTLHISSTAESAEGSQLWIGGVFVDPPALATQPAK